MAPHWLFWIAFIAMIYPYAIYPVAAAAVARLRARKVRKSAIEPTVTVVIAAYNEARSIGDCVRNKLEQDYPADRLRVVVISDASADGTDEIVASIGRADARVRLLRQEPRAGKTAALNAALAGIDSEIVVFADANSMFARDALRHIVANFADPDVGYVTGKMVYVANQGSTAGAGSSAFMTYENLLREIETRIGSVVGVDGGVDAVRRSLYVPMRPDQLPDFVLPLNVVEQGRRVVFEPAAQLQEEALEKTGSEFRMRVRVALRAFWALWDKRRLLLPWNSGIFAWQLWSHKLLRYMSFLPALIAICCLAWLAVEHRLYSILAVVAVVAVLFAFVASSWRGTLGTVARLIQFFVLVNAASAVAFAKFLRGHKQVVWQPRVG